MKKTAKIRDLKIRLLEVSKITNPDSPKEKEEEDRLLERLIVISTDSSDGKYYYYRDLTTGATGATAPK